MSEMVADCPRCGANNITLDVYGDISVGVRYGWQSLHEVMAVCRRCHAASIFKAFIIDSDQRNAFRSANSLRGYNGVINDVVRIEGPLTLRDQEGQDPPELVPEPIASVFKEGSSSFAAGCYNAAGAMFRLCLDLATKAKLPPEESDEQPTPDRRQRKDLAPRLEWLFENGRLPRDLQDLAACVREHGNDGAHDGTLTQVDAADLLDFTEAMLDRIYTEPGKVEAARIRRAARRSS